MIPNAETAPHCRGADRSGATLLLHKCTFRATRKCHAVRGAADPRPCPSQDAPREWQKGRLTTVHHHSTAAGGAQAPRPATNPTSQLLDLKYRLEDWLFRCSEAIQDHAPDESAEDIWAEIERYLDGGAQ